MNGEAGYESISQGKGGPSGLGVEQTRRLSSHISVVNDKRHTSDDQGGAHSETEC